MLHRPESAYFVASFMAFSISSIVGLSFSIAMGILFSILACTLKTDDKIGANWYPLVVVFSYAMVPAPVVLMAKGPPAWKHWAWFTTGWIALSSFGIVVVYRVAGTIASGNMALSLAGSFVCYSALLISLWYNEQSNKSTY